MPPIPGFRMQTLVLIPLAALLVGWSVADDDAESQIKSDERVVFFDTVAHRDAENGRWVALVHGWIFEPVDSLVRREAIEQAIVAGFDREISPEEQERFDRRVNSFLVDNERGKEIPLEVESETYVLPPSESNGHFLGSLELTAEERPAGGTIILRTHARDGRTFEGRIHLLGPAGISVISDIDDTVKITEIHDLEKMITNTFLEEYRAVPGMPELYRSWREAGATFHYISSSPWHLVEPLTEFMDRVGLPRATLHLKQVRLKDSRILDLFRPGTETKPLQVRPLLERFPKRRFILVGDSGEEDPEVYAALREEFPDQIVVICIRNVTGAKRDDARFSGLFGELAPSFWYLFDDPKELEGLLSSLR